MNWRFSFTRRTASLHNASGVFASGLVGAVPYEGSSYKGNEVGVCLKSLECVLRRGSRSHCLLSRTLVRWDWRGAGDSQDHPSIAEAAEERKEDDSLGTARTEL